MNCNPVYNNKYINLDANNQRYVRWEKKTYCGFCFRNGRPFDCYMSHNLKLENGKVVCPILRLYKCPLCFATGDKAHTRKYCPHPERYRVPLEVEKFCGFCQQNGESRDSYTNHNLKGSGGIVTCPILREYVCPYCAATGDKAHTKTYCPITIERNNGIRPVAPCLLLKWTKYQSNMKRRF